MSSSLLMEQRFKEMLCPQSVMKADLWFYRDLKPQAYVFMFINIRIIKEFMSAHFARHATSPDVNSVMRIGTMEEAWRHTKVHHFFTSPRPISFFCVFFLFRQCVSRDRNKRNIAPHPHLPSCKWRLHICKPVLKERGTFVLPVRHKQSLRTAV